MRTILFILRKEFLQIFRHRIMVILIFVMPVIQLLILANAADYEVKNINLYLLDKDLSGFSQRLVSKFQSSEHFNLVEHSFSNEAGMDFIQRRKADMILEIPQGFERTLLREDEAAVHLQVDAINGVKAGIASGYAMAIINTFNGEIRQEVLRLPEAKPPGRIELSYRNWFNPELEYYTFMVPGILVLLVTLVGMFLSGMNIVKEKEIGTIEQINVSPIRKYQFIIGKLFPFWIIGNVELLIGLVIGKLVFQIPYVGSLPLVFAFASVYLLVVLGLGLLISTITETQQQAMFLSWFLLVIFILMSGLFTPIESMPLWAQEITHFNPIAYFVKVMRMVLLKGSGWLSIQSYFFTMLIFAFVINTLAVLNYRKTN